MQQRVLTPPLCLFHLAVAYLAISMPRTDEFTVQQALAALDRGDFTSYRAAGQAHGVKHILLWRRHKGITTTRAIAHENEQILSPIQEQMLVDWILYCETCGYGLSHAQVREFVTLLSTSTGGPSRLGANWVPRFLERHPSLKTKIGKRIDAARVNNANAEDLKRWYDRLHALKSRLKVTLDNLYNCDETGIALGVCVNTRVIGDAATRSVRVKRPGNREWVSIVECISVLGRKLKPLIIYKAKLGLQRTWFPQNALNIPDFLYTHSENGWTSNDISLKWLLQIFLPETSPTPTRPLSITC